MPFRLDNRVALVTGGASGIGEATCRVLSAAGATVVVADLNAEAAQKLAAELGNAQALPLDIANESAVNTGMGALDRLDILVNNAGIGLVGSIEETSLADFERLMLVNVTGMFLV